MKRIMYGSIALFFFAAMLTVGIHIGHQTATAQVPEPIAQYEAFFENYGSPETHHYVVLSNGDVYDNAHDPGSNGLGTTRYLGNYWTSVPVPTQTETMGGVKGKYR